MIWHAQSSYSALGKSGEPPSVTVRDYQNSSQVFKVVAKRILLVNVHLHKGNNFSSNLTPCCFLLFKGVPVRVELGPRDVKNSEFVLVRRDTGERLTLQAKDSVAQIMEMLETIQNGLFIK